VLVDLPFMYNVFKSWTERFVKGSKFSLSYLFVKVNVYVHRVI